MCNIWRLATKFHTDMWKHSQEKSRKLVLQTNRMTDRHSANIKRDFYSDVHMYTILKRLKKYSPLRFHRWGTNKNNMVPCEKCPRKFPDNFQLREHMKIRHREGLICSHCSSKLFLCKSGLRYLQGAVRGKFYLYHRCNVCGKTCIQKTHIDGHMNGHGDY